MIYRFRNMASLFEAGMLGMALSSIDFDFHTSTFWYLIMAWTACALVYITRPSR